jgi:putative DNA primase/helicase
MISDAFTSFAEENDLGPDQLDPHYRNDVGYADAFAQRYEGRLKYIAEEGAWLVFNDRNGWRRDTSGEVKGLFVNFARELYREACASASKVTNPRDGAVMIAAAARLGDKKRIAPAIDFASVNRRLVVAISDLDREPHLLGAQNGVVDLRDGSFRPHSPDVLITRSCACDFDPEATCPTFERFLEEVQPDPDVRGYLQRLWGYTLTGYLGEHILPFHFGVGANGKGTSLEVVVFKLMGSYAAKLTDSLVYLDKRGSIPHLEIAGLCGIRFALGEENADGGNLNERLLKSLTGGDRQKGRFHYKGFFEYTPTAKIHLVGNHRPRISGRDDGIWRRFRLIDWPVKVPVERQDFKLADKLQPEFPGILNWLIAGALALEDRGTQPPECVIVATAKFREDSDAFGEFLRDKTIDDPQGEIGKGELFDLYKTWAEEQDLPARAKHTKRRIGFLMVERGYDEIQLPKGKRVWTGIRQRKDDDLPEDSLGGAQERHFPKTPHAYTGKEKFRENTSDTHPADLFDPLEGNPNADPF